MLRKYFYSVAETTAEGRVLAEYIVEAVSDSEAIRKVEEMRTQLMREDNIRSNPYCYSSVIMELDENGIFEVYRIGGYNG